MESVTRVQNLNEVFCASISTLMPLRKIWMHLFSTLPQIVDKYYDRMTSLVLFKKLL